MGTVKKRTDWAAIVIATVGGAGFSPVGFQFNWLPEKRVQPLFELTAGFIRSAHEFPLPDSTRWNFTLSIGLGLQFSVRPGRLITAGYKLHHVSNANLGDVNPGINTNVFFAGFSWFK